VADTIQSRGGWLVAAVVALGAVGEFNRQAIAESGQINQATALFVSVALVWLCRATRRPRVRLLAAALGGYVVMAGYPELLVAAPLYLACIVLIDGGKLRPALAVGAVFALGALAGLVFAELRPISYLVGQSEVGNHTMPFARPPTNLAEAWLFMLIGLYRAPWLLLAIPLAAAGVWRFARGGPHARPARLGLVVALVGLVGLVAVWSWALSRALNVNYSTFKLAGWLGPGLFLFGWLAVGYARPTARALLTGLLLSLALVRVADFVVTRPEGSRLRIWARYAERTNWRLEPLANADTACRLVVQGGGYANFMRAAAATSAPLHDCQVVLEPAPSR
jgi:hypothetical protein